MTQIGAPRRSSVVNADCDAADRLVLGDDTADAELEAIFRAEYPRVCRLLARITGDPGRAEDIAVDVFLRFWRARNAAPTNPGAWLCRVAVRAGLDELRRRARRARYESLFSFLRAVPTPEEIHSASEEQRRVRTVLGVIGQRKAGALLLRGDGFSYAELASVLGIKPSSIGAFISRAEQTFRKEFIRRYGE